MLRLAFVGPTGAGKSSLMNAIAGADVSATGVLRPTTRNAIVLATVEAFDAMGYAASAIGNHELDWTVDTLVARMREARFPWLAANVRTATGARPAWARPWTMLRAGGTRANSMRRPGISYCRSGLRPAICAIRAAAWPRSSS